jgi:hypothetical protein
MTASRVPQARTARGVHDYGLRVGIGLRVSSVRLFGSAITHVITRVLVGVFQKAESCVPMIGMSRRLLVVRVPVVGTL